MKEYQIVVIEVLNHRFHVEADNEDEALAKLREQILRGELEPSKTFSDGMDTDNINVYDIEEVA